MRFSISIAVASRFGFNYNDVTQSRLMHHLIETKKQVFVAFSALPTV